MTDEREVELKPCPFCAGESHVASMRAAGLSWWFGECGNDECQARGPERGIESRAIAAWNTRALSRSEAAQSEHEWSVPRFGTDDEHECRRCGCPSDSADGDLPCPGSKPTPPVTEVAEVVERANAAIEHLNRPVMTPKQFNEVGHTIEDLRDILTRLSVQVEECRAALTDLLALAELMAVSKVVIASDEPLKRARALVATLNAAGDGR